MTCSKCLSNWLLVPAEGTQSPNTGRELSFAEFLRLVHNADSRKAIAPLLKQWFGYRISGVDTATQIVDAKHVAVDMLSLHLRIQEDEEQQRSFYQTAMSLDRDGPRVNLAGRRTSRPDAARVRR